MRDSLSSSKSRFFAHTDFQMAQHKCQSIGAAALCMQHLRLKGLVVFERVTISALLAAACQWRAVCFLTYKISNKTTRKQIVLVCLSAFRIMRSLILRPEFINSKRNSRSAINYFSKYAYGCLWTNNTLCFDNSRFWIR